MSHVFECFTGEFVRIVLTKDNKSSVQFGQGVKTVYAPMLIEGFLIDEDDDYFFVGFEPEIVWRAVKKDQVVLIEMADPNEEMAHELNDAVPTPENDLGVN